MRSHPEYPPQSFGHRRGDVQGGRGRRASAGYPSSLHLFLEHPEDIE